MRCSIGARKRRSHAQCELRGEVSRRRVKIGVGRKCSPPTFSVSLASRLRSPRRNSDELKGVVLRRDFDRRLNMEFHGSRIELEGITMDFKKFIADLAARYRKLTEPTPTGPVVDVDAAYEAGRKAGYEAGNAEGYEAGRKAGYEDGHAEGYDVGRQAVYEGSRAEGYEAGYKKGYDEGFQIGLEANTPPEAPEPQPEPPPPKSEP